MSAKTSIVMDAAVHLAGLNYTMEDGYSLLIERDGREIHLPCPSDVAERLWKAGGLVISATLTIEVPDE